MTLRWRPIAETPSREREITALIRCRDEQDTYLLPGPVRWNGSEWVYEDTDRSILYQPDAEYHWIPEADLL